MSVLGVDVSHWQGRMDWAKTASAGAHYAFIKATEGLTFTDPRLDENVKGSIAAGLFASLYHFYRPQYDPERQASVFAGMFNYYINILPETAQPIIDLEVSPSTSTAVFRANLLAFIDALKQLVGRDPVIYTNVSFYNTYLQNLGLEQYPLWIAYYNASATKPLLPRGITDWEFWQYTSSGNGSYYGASSARIDLNTFNGTYAEFEAKYLEPTTPPQPCPGTPPQQYRAERYWVHPVATCSEQLKVFAIAMDRGTTFCWSFDEALQGNLEDKTAVFWNVPVDEQAELAELAARDYPGAKVEFKSVF